MVRGIRIAPYRSPGNPLRSKFTIVLLILGLSGHWHSPAWAVGVRDVAPTFERAPLAGGEPVALSAFRGQIVYLDFWASWCAPCRKSMPLMETFYQQYQSRGFTVLAINLDARIDEAQRFLREYPVSYPVLRDRGTLPALYGVEIMPTSYLIDRKGIVRYVHYGYRSGDADGIRQVIEQLLEEQDAN